MLDEQPTSRSIIRLAIPDDIIKIEELDSLSTSPTRYIHREMEKYFGSVDPTTHERTLIFLYEVDGTIVAKAELMLPPLSPHEESWQGASGYIKRVVVRPEFRKRGLARDLMLHIIGYAQKELQLSALDLHVWEMNRAAIRLYENLGFELQHRELYFRLSLDPSKQKPHCTFNAPNLYFCDEAINTIVVSHRPSRQRSCISDMYAPRGTSRGLFILPFQVYKAHEMRETIGQVMVREDSETPSPEKVSFIHTILSKSIFDHNRWRWMRHYFSEDSSPDNHATIDLQRRASWIGVAVILQAVNEIPHKYYLPYVPFMYQWSAFIPFILVAASLVAMCMAFRVPSRRQRAVQDPDASHTQPRPRRWQRIIVVCLLISSVVGIILLGRAVALSFFMPPEYSNDGTSLDANAAILLIEGRNPYTDSNIINVVREFPVEAYWTTPLRVGQFANRLTYPSTADFRSVLDTDLKAGLAPEFESRVSYPSLSFLTLIPFVWLNIYNVLSFYLLSYVVLVAIAWKSARSELRPWIILLSLANASMLVSVMSGNLDVFNILLVAVAWLLRDRRWWSALFLGLALASKQISWFFVPFYAVMVWRQYTFVESARRLTIAGTVALLLNLPFILWNFHAWVAGVMAPMADPMFPEGVGIVGLATTPPLSFFPQIVYNVLELAAMLVTLLWYWRICRKHPEAAMVLAIIPLFFAWRSLSSYFYCSAFPLFMLIAARTLPTKRRFTSQVLDQSSLWFDHNGSVINQIPAPLGARVAFQSTAHDNYRDWTTAKFTFVWRGLSSMLIPSPKSAPPPTRG